MTIVESPDIESPPLEDLDAGVIEEARGRERRHRAIAATLAFVAAGIAGIILIVGGGGSGGGTHATRGPTPAQPRPLANAPATLAACSSHPNGVDEGTPSRSLLSILGVLRRPAAHADALPRTDFDFFTIGVARVRGEEVFVRYVRRARVIGNTSYYLIPSVFTGCGVLKLTGEGITLWAAQKPNGSGSGGGHADAGRIEQGKAYLTPSGASTHTTIAMLIPDGVATVTLEYPPGAVGGSNYTHAPAFTTTAHVVQNLLVVTVPRGGHRFMTPMTMTWRAANGTTVKTFHSL
jgi:hypothetical protein